MKVTSRGHVIEMKATIQNKKMLHIIKDKMQID